jgi:hypothetical protein
MLPHIRVCFQELALAPATLRSWNERIAWPGRSNRLANDYERLPERSQALLQMALSRLMLARLARQQQARQHQKQHSLALPSPPELAA